MATASASYRNPQPHIEQKQPDENFVFTPGQLCRDLEQLCAQGFLEAFRDEYNIVRYRPTNRVAQ